MVVGDSATMLFPNRPASFKLFGSTTFITICFLFLFSYYIFSLEDDRRFLDPLRQSSKSKSCDLDSLDEATLNAPHASPTPNPDRLVPVPLSPSPITWTVENIVTQTQTLYLTQTSAATPTAAATHSPNLPGLKPIGIPQKFWYKLGPKGLSDDSLEHINTCLEKNPTYRREFLTDTSGDHYVREYFSHRRDIVDVFHALTVPILKADLLRYMILYAEGGVWSDLDVSCEDVAISQWIPKEYKNATGLVVGLEFDMPWENDNFLHTQFASWTIMAKPGVQHLWQVIEDILMDLQKAAKEHEVPVKDLTLEMLPDVVDLTGPKRMTRSIVKSMEMTLDDTVDDRNISGLLTPKLVGDVLILPGNSFAASQNGYPEDQGPPFVAHHYAGSWKNDHGGEMA